MRSRQTLFSGPLLTAAQLRAWTEYDRVTRVLRDPLAPLRDALQAAARAPNPAETLDTTIERVLRALASADRAYPELWLDRLARYRWEAGHEWRDVAAEARSAQLARYRHARRADEPLEVVVVPGHPGALCAPCQAIAGARYDLRTMTGRSPLPVAGCACFTSRTRPEGLCTCWYALRDLPLTPRERALTDLLRAALLAWLARMAPPPPPPPDVQDPDERLARAAPPIEALDGPTLDEDDVGVDREVVAGHGAADLRDVPHA